MITNMKEYNNFNLFIDRVKEACSQFPEYRDAFLWLLSDLFKAYPLAMIRLTAFSMCGASLQGAVLVGAIKFVQALEKKATFNIANIEFVARDSQTLFLAVCVFFLLMSLSALLMYLAGAGASKLISKYHAYCQKRALALFGTVIPGSSAPKKANEAYTLIIKNVLQDTQKMAMLVRFFASSIPNLVILVYAFPALVYIDLSMTIVLIVLVILFLPLFYYTNIQAYRSDLMMKRSGAGANKTLQALMDEINDFQYISPSQIEAINKAFNKGKLREKTESMPQYFLTIAQTELWTNIMLGLGVSLVIIFQVQSALEKETSWSMIVAYLSFLKLGVNAFKGIMSFMTKFSRFYPYIHRYQNFVLSVQRAGSANSRLMIKAADHGIYEFKKELEINRPMLLALVTGVPLSRYSFPYLVKLGSRADNGIFVSPQECFFIGSKGLPQRDGSLRSMLNLSQDFSVQDLKQAMPGELLEAVKTNLGLDLDQDKGPDKWAKLSLAHRVELGLVAVMLNPAKVLVLDQDTLSQLPKERSKPILGQMTRQKSLIVIRYPEQVLEKNQPFNKFEEDLCAVAGCTSNLLALGSPKWIQAQRETVLDLLAKEQVKLQKEGRDEDSDEYIDDE